jgi:hypothetical protein
MFEWLLIPQNGPLSSFSSSKHPWIGQVFHFDEPHFYSFLVCANVWRNDPSSLFEDGVFWEVSLALLTPQLFWCLHHPLFPLCNFCEWDKPGMVTAGDLGKNYHISTFPFREHPKISRHQGEVRKTVEAPWIEELKRLSPQEQFYAGGNGTPSLDLCSGHVIKLSRRVQKHPELWSLLQSQATFQVGTLHNISSALPVMRRWRLQRSQIGLFWCSLQGLCQDGCRGISWRHGLQAMEVPVHLKRETCFRTYQTHAFFSS